MGGDRSERLYTGSGGGDREERQRHSLSWLRASQPVSLEWSSRSSNYAMRRPRCNFRQRYLERLHGEAALNILTALSLVRPQITVGHADGPMTERQLDVFERRLAPVQNTAICVPELMQAELMTVPALVLPAIRALAAHNFSPVRNFLNSVKKMTVRPVELIGKDQL